MSHDLETVLMSGKAILISGKTQGGKTRLMDQLLQRMPDSCKVVTIKDQPKKT